MAAPPSQDMAPWLAYEGSSRGGTGGTARLHEEILLLEKYSSLTKHERIAKSNFVSLITTLIKAEYPSAVVSTFGSFAAGSGVFLSDVDLAVADIRGSNSTPKTQELRSKSKEDMAKATRLPNKAQRKQARTKIQAKFEAERSQQLGDLECIYHLLRDKSWWIAPQNGIILRRGAVVPIIRVRHFSGLEADIRIARPGEDAVTQEYRRTSTERYPVAFPALSNFLKCLVRYQQLIEDAKTYGKASDGTSASGRPLNKSDDGKSTSSNSKAPPDYDPDFVGPSFSGGLGSYFLDAIAGQTLATVAKSSKRIETDLTPALLLSLVTPERQTSFFTKWKLCGVQRVDWRGFARTRYGEICMRARASLVPLLMEQPAHTVVPQGTQGLDGSGTGAQLKPPGLSQPNEPSLGAVPPYEEAQQGQEGNEGGGWQQGVVQQGSGPATLKGEPSLMPEAPLLRDSMLKDLFTPPFVAMREAHRVAAAAVWTSEQVEALFSKQPEGGPAQGNRAVSTFKLRALAPDAVSTVRQSLSSMFRALLSRSLGPALMAHLPPPIPLTRYSTSHKVGTKRLPPGNLADTGGKRQKAAKCAGAQSAKAGTL